MRLESTHELNCHVRIVSSLCVSVNLDTDIHV